MKTLKITFVMLMTALFLVLPSCSKDDVITRVRDKFCSKERELV